MSFNVSTIFDKYGNLENVKYVVEESMAESYQTLLIEKTILNNIQQLTFNERNAEIFSMMKIENAENYDKESSLLYSASTKEKLVYVNGKPQFINSYVVIFQIGLYANKNKISPYLPKDEELSDSRFIYLGDVTENKPTLIKPLLTSSITPVFSPDQFFHPNSCIDFSSINRNAFLLIIKVSRSIYVDKKLTESLIKRDYLEAVRIKDMIDNISMEMQQLSLRRNKLMEEIKQFLSYRGGSLEALAKYLSKKN